MKQFLDSLARLSRRLFPHSAIERLVFLLILAVAAITFVLYGWLPHSFPTHLNRELVIDGTMEKPAGPFVLPLTAIVLLCISTIVSRAASSFYPPAESFLSAVLALLPAALALLQLALVVMLLIR